MIRVMHDTEFERWAANKVKLRLEARLRSFAFGRDIIIEKTVIELDVHLV